MYLKADITLLTKVHKLFELGGQSIGTSVLASTLQINIQGWFPLRLTGLISLQSKGLKSLLQYHNSNISVNSLALSLLYRPTLTSVHDYWKNHESHSAVSNSLQLHGILQARILELVAFPFSRGSSQPRDRTQVSRTADGFFTSWATREVQEYRSG